MITKITSFFAVLTLLLVSSLNSNYSYSQVTTPAPFITLWNTNLGGVNDTYYIEFVTSGTYKVEIKHIDSTSYVPPMYPMFYGDNASQQIIVPVVGIYYVKMTPFDTTSFPGPLHYFSVNTPYNPYNPPKLLRVEQWGDIEWSSFDNSFEGASNLLVTASDNPDLGGVTDMSYAFAGTQNLNQNVTNWDMSNVTNTRGMFAGVTYFNQDISSWNVSNVTIMDSMFAGATNFDQDLGNWNVGNVTSMAYLFAGSSSMNGLATKGNAVAKSAGIGGWDVSKVVNMEGMFQNATSFNQEIGGWDVSKVVNMEGMFQNAMSYNQGIGGWDVSKVVNMKNMFQNATSYNQGIGGWDVSKVINMEGMFQNAKKFNQGIGGWDVSKVVNMKSMFQDALKFNQEIGGWDVSKVKNMENIFENAAQFNQNLGGWDVSKLGVLPGVENDFSFDFSGMDCANYGATLRGWRQNVDAPFNIRVSALGMSYPSADEPFRTDLINLYGWQISGDYKDPSCTPLAISTLFNGEQLEIYPNPVINEVTISGLEGVETIEFLDITGRVVLSNQINNVLVTINLENLSNGIYTIIINGSNGERVSTKIVKQ